MIINHLYQPASPDLPADLVIATDMHRLAAMVERVQSSDERAKIIADDHTQALAARSLLIQIARDCSLPVVLKALAATGGPSSVAEIAQRLRAVIDQRRQDSGTPAADAPGACGHPKAPAKESSQ